MRKTGRRRKNNPRDNPRRAEFRAALALNGETASSWAVNRAGVQPGHLSLVLSGVRESARLTRQIDAYIAEFRARMSLRCVDQPARVA